MKDKSNWILYRGYRINLDKVSHVLINAKDEVCLFNANIQVKAIAFASEKEAHSFMKFIDYMIKPISYIEDDWV